MKVLKDLELKFTDGFIFPIYLASNANKSAQDLKNKI